MLSDSSGLDDLVQRRHSSASVLVSRRPTSTARKGREDKADAAEPHEGGGDFLERLASSRNQWRDGSALSTGGTDHLQSQTHQAVQKLLSSRDLGVSRRPGGGGEASQGSRSYPAASRLATSASVDLGESSRDMAAAIPGHLPLRKSLEGGHPIMPSGRQSVGSLLG